MIQIEFDSVRPARRYTLIGYALATALSGCANDPPLADVDGGLAETLPPDSGGDPLCSNMPAGIECPGYIHTDHRGWPIRVAAPPSGVLGANDLAAAYNVQRDTAHHPIVGVLSFGDYASAESELAMYRSQYNLPACTTASGCFKKINKSGQTTNLPGASTAVGEVMLDLEMVSALCPDCHIILVEADTDGTGVDTAIANAATLGAHAVSISYLWGEPSDVTDPKTSTFLNIPGVSIFAASGDAAWGQPSYPGFPATSPYVTAVGGTRLTPHAGTARGFDEVAWTSSPTSWAAAYSVCSGVFGKPSWQTASTGCVTRASADVAAVSHNVAVYVSGAWAIVSGTSVAAPVVAGIYAESHTAGADPGLAYRVLSAFHDIVAGTPDNSSAYYDPTTGVRSSCGNKPICTVGAGWDGPTGNGVPDGKALDPVRVILPQGMLPGTSAVGSVSLTYVPVHDTTMALTSTAFGGVPASVTIGAGKTSASFTFSAGRPTKTTTVTVTATCGSGTICAGATAPASVTVQGPNQSCCVPGCAAPRVCSSSCQCVVPQPGDEELLPDTANDDRCAADEIGP